MKTESRSENQQVLAVGGVGRAFQMKGIIRLWWEDTGRPQAVEGAQGRGVGQSWGGSEAWGDSRSFLWEESDVAGGSCRWM